MNAVIIPMRQARREQYARRAVHRLLAECWRRYNKYPCTIVGEAAGHGVRAIEGGASYFVGMEKVEKALAEKMKKFGYEHDTQRVNEG